MTEQTPNNSGPGSEIAIYQTQDGRNRIQVRIEDETVWLSQRLLSDLYQVGVNTINHHIKSIYDNGELSPGATIRQYRIVQTEGPRQVERLVDHYNLDMILAIGYRVRSPRGVQLRQWATERLREYLIKGFTLDDDRLKGRDKLTDYFDELLARIREIRASEARVYQRIREIFALAVDYVETENETQVFFATIQNKMHYAATGLTAAEIVWRRCDAGKVNMGLTSWSGGRVLKRDVATAKNYLAEKEIDTLNRIVVMFLDQVEFRAQRRQDIRTRDWETFLDKFLRDTELPVLAHAGSVSHEDALSWADEQYAAFSDRRRLGAEAAAEARYVEDLRASAEALETDRKKPTTPKDKEKGKVRRKTKDGE